MHYNGLAKISSLRNELINLKLGVLRLLILAVVICFYSAVAKTKLWNLRRLKKNY